MEIITVKSGDTVFSIANRYGISQQKLIADNGIPQDGALAVGQSLIILMPDEILDVQNNIGVSKIAQNTNTSTRELYRNNFFLSGAQTAQSGSQVVLSYQNTPRLSRFLGGYAYDFINQTLLDSVASYMTYIMPFTYGFRSDGSLIAPNDERIIQTSLRYGAKPLMHLSTLTDYGSFSSALAEQILSDSDAVNVLVNSCAQNVISKGYYGIDVDFEYLPTSSRQGYVDFISKLTNAMNSMGLICIVAVPPKTSDTQTGLLYEGIDYAALGQAADFVFLMTYEWGYRFGPPLPIAPFLSVKRVLDYAVTRIPSNKLILGISNYGYDWTLPYVSGQSDAPSISTEYALELAVRYGAEIMFDEQAKAPFFNYTDEFGKAHIVWFEDARSIEAKVMLIREYELSGGFIWDLMRKNPQMYVTLNALIDIQ